MLLKDVKILRPQSTKIQRRGNTFYVYQVVDQTYNSNKKYTVDKRVCIGKMLDDEYMIPNEKFEQFYPETIVSEVNAPLFSDTLRIGSFILIQKIVNDLKLRDLLEEFFDDVDFVIDLVSYMMINETCNFQYYPQFMRSHPILSQIRSDNYINDYLKRDMHKEDMKVFLYAWNSYHNDDTCIYYNFDCMDHSIRGIELDESLPQVNLSYAIKYDNFIPLFYELYDGNLVDVMQCEHMVELADDFGYKNIGFILDQGYCSEEIIEYLRKYQIEYILMMNNNNSCIKQVMNKVSKKLKNMEGYYISEHEMCGITIKDKLFDQDVYFHVYYDDVRAAQEKNTYLNMLAIYEKELHQKIEKKIVEEELNKKGYFTIVTSKQMEVSKVIDICKGRNHIEKMFRKFNSEIDLNKFSIYSDASLQSKAFIMFISMIIRNEIFKKMEELRKINKKYYAISTMIYELENIEITRNNLGRYTRRYALNNNQKLILKQFGIDEKYIEKEISKINLKIG